MTEDDKDRLRAAKKVITERLAAEDYDRYRLREVDTRLDDYVRSVASDPRGHNLYEQLAVGRFLDMCEKYGINISEVHRFYDFYESLYFPGKKGQQRYRLTPVQAFQFAGIFAFWEGDRRVVREAVLYVPRKFSKTTGTASLALYDMLYGDANAECYTAANSADQAKKCFDVIRGCMRRLDPKERRYVVNEQIIKSDRKDRSAFAQCLTANAKTKDGLNASTVIMDEFSQARDSELLTVLTTSMGVRDNPLTVIITTASDVFDGPFYQMLQGYKSVLLGEYADDALFAHIFEPDIDDPEDAESTWRKVHPHLGVTVNADFYEQEYKKAMRNGAEAMLAFRTKLLNVFAENEQRPWISGRLAREISRPISLDAIQGRPDAMVAFDLSESDDFSAVSVGWYSATGSVYKFHTAYFFPEGALSGHPNEKLYRSWAAKGYLKLTKGDVIDYREIVDYIMYIKSRVRILGIGYDAWRAHEIVNTLKTIGGPQALKKINQTYGYFTAPVESFEHGVKTGRIVINDNPINAYCFSNAVLDYDRMENCKPVKRMHNQKIDGVITMLMCMRLYLDVLRY